MSENYWARLSHYYDKHGLHNVADEIDKRELTAQRRKKELTPEEIKMKALKQEIDVDVRRAGIKLLSVNADPKTFKSFKSGKGYLTGILYLAPYKLSGKNVCPCASKGCIEACLHTAGNPAFMESKQKGRINKTKWFFGMDDVKTYKKSEQPTRAGFLERLQNELMSLKQIAESHGLNLAVRLNGTSDIGWHGVLREFMKQHQDIRFYDYTKVLSRVFQQLEDPENFNVHQTFSRSEENHAEALSVLEKGGNVAVVFDKVPETWHGYQVVKGDEDDLRFLDDEHKEHTPLGKPIGLVIGLKAKGDAIKQYRAEKEQGFGPEQHFVVRATDMPGFPYL
jgi:hypothetical protein